MQDEIPISKKQTDFIITNISCIEKNQPLTEEEQDKKDLQLLHQITNQNFRPSKLKNNLTQFLEIVSSMNIPSLIKMGKVVNTNKKNTEKIYESRIKSFNNNLNSFHERLEFIRENNKKFKNIINFIYKMTDFGFILDKTFDINENDNIIDIDNIILQHRYLKYFEDLFNIENKNFKIIYSPLNICKISSDFYDYYNNEYSFIFSLKLNITYIRLEFNHDVFENKLLQNIMKKREMNKFNELQYTDDMFLFYKEYLLYKFMKEEINGILRYLKEKKEITFENKGLTFTCSRKPGKLLMKCEYFDNFSMVFTIEKVNKIKDQKVINNIHNFYKIIKPYVELFCDTISRDIRYYKNINNFISSVKKNQHLTLENIIKSGIFIKRLSKLGVSILRFALNHIINVSCKELNIINTDYIDSSRYFSKYQIFFKFIQNGNEFSYSIYLYFDTNLNLRINVKEPFLNHIYINDRGMNIYIEKGKINFKEIKNILKNIVPKLTVNSKNGTYLKIISV